MVLLSHNEYICKNTTYELTKVEEFIIVVLLYYDVKSYLL